jgi:hypothetical protein
VDSLLRYEVITPFDVAKASAARHPAHFSLSLTAFGRQYHLHLRRHVELLPPSYAEWSLTADGYPSPKPQTPNPKP